MNIKNDFTMSYPRPIILALIFCLLPIMSVVSIGCSKYVNSDKDIQSNENIISADGTIVYQELEGGFFGIITDNGDKYNPVNLPKEFQKDGLKVRFKGKINHDLVGIHMWGKLFEITRISEL